VTGEFHGNNGGHVFVAMMKHLLILAAAVVSMRRFGQTAISSPQKQ
jgi:hypothetical protein